uniref:Uncharacterized protein n=1 Tax=Oryza rufipogon TaxID=4529 RepID=A0A0E0RH16_ORYRU
MDGAANSPSRCKTMVAPSPFPRPLSEGWWRRHLIPRPCPLAAGTISVPFPSQFGCRRISLELVRHLRELPGLVRHLCGLTICYPRTLLLPRHQQTQFGSLQWPTRCHGHMCGGDGSIQAHIKACAALRAISVVTAHNTISSGLLASYLEEAQLFYESYCHQYIGSILGL